MNLEYKDGKVYADLSVMADIAKRTGLRSKKRRHIIKRFKLVLINGLKELINNS
jgi:hypothetical protein